MRSPCSPIDKYNLGAATSHEIGWHVETPSVLRKPRFGIKESETTRFAHNMKATRSEVALRLILP